MASRAWLARPANGHIGGSAGRSVGRLATPGASGTAGCSSQVPVTFPPFAGSIGVGVG